MRRWLALVAAAPLLAAQPVPLQLPAGTPVLLETAQPLSSKTAVNGDRVELRTVKDVLAGTVVVIPKGTRAVGQIADARAKGAMGMSGRLTVSPLYIAFGDRYIRLVGAAVRRARVSGGGVVGLATLGGAFTGRSAVMPEGAPVEATTLSAVTIDIAPVAAP